MSNFAPAAAMVYTDIQTLRGLSEPADYGSGIEYADGILDSLFPHQHVGLQIGLWLNGTRGCRDIVSGSLEENVSKLIDYLSKTKAAKVFLRVGYEFDNPSFGYLDDPEIYAEAFRYLVLKCRQVPACTEKVRFVWHSWAATKNPPLKDFYPGNHFVDWIGVSIFSQFFPWAEDAGTLQDIASVLQFAQERKKPIMIAESTPFGGIDLDIKLTRVYNMTDPWERWFQPTLDLIDEYDIGMWSYINCDWESQPMWHNVGFGETRLSTNKRVMRKWRKKILGGRRDFLLADSLTNCGKQLTHIHDENLITAASLQESIMSLRWDRRDLLTLIMGGFGFYVFHRIFRRRILSGGQEAYIFVNVVRYGSITRV
jgi:hypothetical protein